MTDPNLSKHKQFLKEYTPFEKVIMAIFVASLIFSTISLLVANYELYPSYVSTLSVKAGGFACFSSACVLMIDFFIMPIRKL